MGPRVVEHAAGFTWVAAKPAIQQQASHALVSEGRVWVIDPTDWPGLDDALRGRGEVVAVLQLLDRHPRACAAIATRLGVPHLRLPRDLAGSPFEVVPAVWFPKWRELALWWPQLRVLVVAEALGTASYYRAGSETVGIHPFVRPCPPRRLGRFEPQHLLVGHGEPVTGPETAAAISQALRTSRRGIPALLVRLVTTRKRARR